MRGPLKWRFKTRATRKIAMDENTNANYANIVSQVMEIEDLTWGDPKRDYVVRFRGRLTTDQTDARNRLNQAFKIDKLSPILRSEDGRDVIMLISDPISSIVARVFDIQDTQWGESNQIFLVRYLGRLTQDSISAYDLLEKECLPRELTPLFREEEGQHAIILLKGVNRPRPSNPVTNLILFLLTLVSITLVGAMNVYTGDATNLTEYFQDLFGNLGAGLPFALSLMAILLAHEFGHYIAGRIHKTPVTLPYFLPLPVQPFGTLGAFIQLRGAPKNKRILHDIGIAGPLAGLAVAIPVLILGLSLSELNNLPLSFPQGQLLMEGNSILYLLAKFAVFGQWLPSPLDYGGMDPFLYWLRYFFTGAPFPLGGLDVTIHPVALAGWGGLLITALNLIPAGQLDGGHIIYVLLGRKARRLMPFILGLMVVLGFSWQGWWLFAILISFMGRTFAEPLDQITRLDSRRRTIAWMGVVIFFLVFTPVPLMLVGS